MRGPQGASLFESQYPRASVCIRVNPWCKSVAKLFVASCAELADTILAMLDSTMNSLAHASSAYLRSAMHQPIRWHQWGEEAFAAAQRENKPILLDIGAVR